VGEERGLIKMRLAERRGTTGCSDFPSEAFVLLLCDMRGYGIGFCALKERARKI
jgi:hypothetical protein